MSIFNIDDDLKAFMKKAEPTVEEFHVVALKAGQLAENLNAAVTEFREFMAAFKSALASTTKESFPLDKLNLHNPTGASVKIAKP